ncbi:hypothetical protein SAMN03159341_11681 [Paenibacillus sp. 1_12]|uniref:DUF1868 domain-containing protein n=1 Tax=Paenibacillus sp. 1_12 TaxID=1566278 RepID=UPI0008ED3559|nr:DUF1868 domain-containing protein [Paenibacillus sp. 1_12]SFM09895.1 hypothetical protein SAMN03159341_11681 [Paenibacillus sp. 1_12]
MNHSNASDSGTDVKRMSTEMIESQPVTAAASRDQRVFTKVVGRKFHEDGSVRHFPGNTIICPVDPTSAVNALLVRLVGQFRKLSCSRSFTLLPPSSYHMTVIQGVCEDDRKPQLWTSFLPLDAPLEETDRLFREKWETVHVPDGFNLKFDYLHTGGVALTVNLQPLTEDDAQKLKVFRNEVSDKLGLRFPDHDDYRFHLSIGYRIVELTEEEEEELLGFKEQTERELEEHFGIYASMPPQLVFFKDMFKFADSR